MSALGCLSLGDGFLMGGVGFESRGSGVDWTGLDWRVYEGVGMSMLGLGA